MSSEQTREVRMLSECVGVIDRLLAGKRPTWLDLDVFRDAWAMCQARGIADPRDYESSSS